jgi:hypothetical protein
MELSNWFIGFVWVGGTMALLNSGQDFQKSVIWPLALGAQIIQDAGYRK